MTVPALRRIGLGLLLAALAGALLFLAFGGIFLDVYDKLVRTPADFVLIRGTSRIIDYVRAHRTDVIAWHRGAGGAALALSMGVAAAAWRVTRGGRGPAPARRVARAASALLPFLIAAQLWGGARCAWKDVYEARAFGNVLYSGHLRLLPPAIGIVTGVLLYALRRVTRASREGNVSASADGAPEPSAGSREARRLGGTWREWAVALAPAWGAFWRAGIACFLLEYLVIAVARPVTTSGPFVGALFVATQIGLGVAFVGAAFLWVAALHAAWRVGWGLLARVAPAGPDLYAVWTGAALCALLAWFLLSNLFSPYQNLILHLQLDTAADALSVLAAVVVWYPLTDLLRTIAARRGLGPDAFGLSGFLAALGEAVGRLPLWPVEAAARWVAPASAGVERAARAASPFVLLALGVLLGALIEFHFNDFYRYFNIALAQWFFLIAVLWVGACRRPVPVPRAVAVLRAMVLLGLVVVAERVFTLREEVRFLCFERTELSRMAVLTLRRQLDRDGDGVSAWLAGGDVDDGDPAIHPIAGRYEYPGAPTDWGRLDAGGAAGAPLPEGTNVFVLSIDALRWDAMGTYGYRRPTTPRLDAFARSCVLFERAYAQNSASYGSLNSLFMGRYTTRNFLPGKRQRRYLADILSDRGYDVGLTLETESRAFGRFPAIWEGKEYLREGTGRSVPGLIARWLDGRDGRRPFLLWVHLAEPHYPFEFHPEVADFGRAMRDLYDNEVAYADRVAGRLLDLFQARGLIEKTVIVVTADHGESTGEHGTLYHGMNVYEEAIRVPLMIRAPGVAPRRVPPDQIAALIDLVPTLEDLLGVPAEAREPAHGLSLAPLLRGTSARIRRDWVFSQADFLDMFAGIEGGRWKLVYSRSHNIWELYDLASDPGERVNRIDLDAARGEAMKRAMVGFLLAGKGDWVDPDPFRSD